MEGTLASSLSFAEIEITVFQRGRFLKVGEEKGGREGGGETEMTARQIFHWPVAESVRGLLKNSASLFTNESRKNGNGTGIEWGSSGLFFFSVFCFSAFFAFFFFARFFRDDSLMEDRMRSALPTQQNACSARK